MVLGFELRASNLAGQLLYYFLFCVEYFSFCVCVFLFYLFVCVCVCVCVVLGTFEIRSLELFAQPDFEP
jgi:hypothetical protein